MQQASLDLKKEMLEPSKWSDKEISARADSLAEIAYKKIWKV